LGYGGQEVKEMEISEIIPESKGKLRDGEKCDDDSECLSGACYAGVCQPYDYGEPPYLESGTPEAVRNLDLELSRKGIIEDENYYRERREALLGLEADLEAKELEKSEVEKIRLQQDFIRRWYLNMELKEKENKLTEEEKIEFQKIYDEYKKLTKKEQYALIAKSLLQGVRDATARRLFGGK
jgi:hypothetical protein